MKGWLPTGVCARLALVLVLAGAAACSDTADEPAADRRTATARLADPPEIANFPPPSSYTEPSADEAAAKEPSAVSDPEAVALAFDEEIAVCERLIARLRESGTPSRELRAALDRPGGAIDQALAAAGLASADEIKYIQAHPRYFVLGPVRLGSALYASIDPASGLGCGTSRARLDEIEGLGASPNAWTMRERFLTDALRQLPMPWEGMERAEQQFERLRLDVREATERYHGPERDALIRWVNAAAVRLQHERARAPSVAEGLSGAELRGKIDEWIRVLAEQLAASPNGVATSDAALEQARR